MSGGLDMEERKCAWCGADISHRKLNAKFCGNVCKEAARLPRKRAATRRRWPPMQGRSCKGCGDLFSASEIKQLFCSISCRTKHNNKIKVRDHRRDYLKAISVDRNGYFKRASERAQKWRERDPEYAKSKDREWQRKRAAAAAISLLIMPIEHSEPNQ